MVTFCGVGDRDEVLKRKKKKKRKHYNKGSRITGNVLDRLRMYVLCLSCVCMLLHLRLVALDVSLSVWIHDSLLLLM